MPRWSLRALMVHAWKLQLKEAAVRVVGDPGGVLDGSVTVAEQGPVLLAFVRTAAELDRHQDAIVASAGSDTLTWIAYPKAGQLGTDLNRDVLWAHVKPWGIRPVRQVSLDDVWSALRFRPS